MLENKQMKKFIISILVLLAIQQGFSQAIVTYQFSNIDKLGIGYQFSQKLWADLRIHNHETTEDLSFDIIALNNFVHRNHHDFYIGAGVNINDYFETVGLVVPIGVQVSPFTTAPQLFFSVEIDNYIYDFDAGFEMPFALGIRYKFK